MRSSNPEALILPAMSVIASASASASARSIMRRSFVDRPLSGIAQGAQVFGQFRDHGFQLVDAAALLVNGLVQRLDQVFLVRQLDFDIDETVFVAHGVSRAEMKRAAL